MTTQEKLAALRLLMKEGGAKALYVACSDPHQSESVAEHWKAVQWLTGFTGSMGYALVTDTEAAFWTDGRYTEQARREIAPDTFRLYTIGTPQCPAWTGWLAQRLQAGEAIAADGATLSEALLRTFGQDIPVKGLRILVGRDYVGEIWKGRPAVPDDPVWTMAPAFAGQSRPEKLERIRAALARHGTRCATLACCLDDIAWITNLRGHDNPLYPFFHAYAVIGKERADLFADLAKFSPAIQASLAADGWTLHGYGQIDGFLRQLPRDTTLLVDPFKTPCGLFDAIPAGVRVLEGPDITTRTKAVKSDAEQQNIREANLRECTAVIRLMRWIEQEAPSGRLEEFAVGRKLEEFRRRDPLYIQPANIPIVAYGANAALPHYRPSRTMSERIRPEGFLLFDVCAHYQCGTTDLTRTVAVGPLTEEMCCDYTTTLKAHITLARQKFPQGTTGNLLDAIVKAGHWNQCMTFGHGTGHGIGYVLNVHEGPAKIITEYAPAFPHARSIPLEAGMLFSNEPGVYKPARHGIRIENSVLVQEAARTEFGLFFGFETVTFLPLERRAIQVGRLTGEEIAWVDRYHAQVFEKLAPRLDADEVRWLARATEPLRPSAN